MKIAIIYKFIEGPWGGANQFLKALRKSFIDKGCYAENPYDADVILFISYPFGNENYYQLIRRIKRKNNSIVVNRLYGPIGSFRGTDHEVDKINYYFNKNISDGTIFQSKWSASVLKQDGLENNEYEAIIHNAPDPEIFMAHNPEGTRKSSKIILIACG